MSLSVQELKDKIEQVSNDITHIRNSGGQLEALTALTSYIEYLKDELRLAESRQNAKE